MCGFRSLGPGTSGLWLKMIDFIVSSALAFSFYFPHVFLAFQSPLTWFPILHLYFPPWNKLFPLIPWFFSLTLSMSLVPHSFIFIFLWYIYCIQTRTRNLFLYFFLKIYECKCLYLNTHLCNKEHQQYLCNFLTYLYTDS